MSKYKCKDCEKEIKVEGENIINGKQLVYSSNEDSRTDKIKILKCDECFNKDKSLSNYKDCEVYSRVVGYIRPVQQWHEGKQDEYKQRKEYKVN